MLELTLVEYEAALRGMQLRTIDQYEFMAKSAMANRYVHHAKHANERKIFDKTKALRSLNHPGNQKTPNTQMLQQANKALSNYQVNFTVENKSNKT